MIQPIEQIDWLNGEGPRQEVVLATRIRLARNLADLPFPSMANENALAEVVHRVGQCLSTVQGVEFHDLSRLSQAHLCLLVERHLISPAFYSYVRPRGLGLDTPRQLSLMINEEDHLRLQFLYPGLQLMDAWHRADQLDTDLDRVLHFAHDRQFGFLTSCLSNVGTGLRASAMLHLPALAWFNALPQIVGQVQQVGLTMRGLYGEGTAPDGNLMQISNQVTLGQREIDILTKVQGVAEHLVESELQARQQLLERYRLQLEDQVWRCLGILRTARLMESGEALRHLSMVRLGLDTGLLPATISRADLTRLLVRLRPANLQFEAQQELSSADRDQRRAAVLRQTLGG